MPRRREGVSKIRLGPDGVQFFMILLKMVTIFSPLRLFLPISAVAFLVGAAYARMDRSDAGARDELLRAADRVSVVILLVGLVSEQISSLRFEVPAVVVKSALVIVPTDTERENLHMLIGELMAQANVTVLVVDDGSPDETGAVADALAVRYRGRMEVMHRTGDRGLGRAYIDGIRTVLAQSVDLDVICQMDADLSHDPQPLPALHRRDRGCRHRHRLAVCAGRRASSTGRGGAGC